MLMFSSDMACSVAGITSDANVLTNELRLIAQRWNSGKSLTFIKFSFFLCCVLWPLWFFFRYLLQYQDPIPCEQLVTALCDIKQAYTQFGGKQLLFHLIVSLLECHSLGTVEWLSILLLVCPVREETVWCFSALHGLGQTLWFSAVSEWPQRQLRRLEGNLYWQQQCCKSGLTEWESSWRAASSSSLLCVNAVEV